MSAAISQELKIYKSSQDFGISAGKVDKDLEQLVDKDISIYYKYRYECAEKT